MRIGVDIDNVLSNFNEVLLKDYIKHDKELRNNGIKKLQKTFYKEIPEEKYNPDKFNFHMTLHIDKNKEVIDELYNILNDNFKPFNIEFNKLTLFNYPGEMIKIIKL